jgi:hypothetical protein
MTGQLSETLVFSVESLLYYAPQVTSLGKQLGAAEATAQQQLLGLGAFWGGSWPDQAFANAYQPTQAAALILVGQLGVEIEGIGGGIQLMARNYGIAEDTNTQDIEQIEANQGYVNDLAGANGGDGSPPDTPQDLPVVSAAGPHPVPQANVSPSPGGGRAPAPSPSPSASATPSPDGSATPSPQAGPPPPESWQIKDQTAFWGPWPSGSPAKMDEAASYWSTLSQELDNAWAGLKRITDYIMADAEGAAATAFYDYVDSLTNSSNGSLTRAIEVCLYLQESCTAQATSIRNVQSRLELLLAETAATFVLGLIFSVITYSTSVALAAAVDAGIEGAADALVAAVDAEGTLLAARLQEGAEIVGKVAGAAAGGAFSGTTIGIADLTVQNDIGEAFGKQPTTGTAALKAILLQAAGSSVGGSDITGGALNESASLLSKQLIETGENSQLPVLVTLGLQLKAGTITVSAASGTLETLIENGKLNAVQLVSNSVGNRLGAAIGPSTGAHAAGY